MSEPESSRDDLGRQVDRLLLGMRCGDAGARQQLFEQAYLDLKQIARRQLRRAARGQTLQTTALVHEAYLRLTGPGHPVRDEVHLRALVARVMRQIVIDHLRARGAAKRDQGRAALSLDLLEPGGPAVHAAELHDLNEAIEVLESHDERLGQLVELRFYGGMTVEEVSQVLEVSPRTVKREWRRARAFLQSWLTGSER